MIAKSFTRQCLWGPSQYELLGKNLVEATKVPIGERSQKMVCAMLHEKPRAQPALTSL